MTSARTLTAIAFAAAAFFAFSAPASAQQLVESYSARLSSADHFNSSGERLTAPAAIIRQDRANFHKFGIRDPEDEGDAYFADQGTRGYMERLLERGHTPRAARNAIVNGSPMVRVELYRGPQGDYIEVTVY